MRSVGVTFFGLDSLAAPMVWSSGCGEAFTRPLRRTAGRAKMPRATAPSWATRTPLAMGSRPIQDQRRQPATQLATRKSCGLCDHLCETGGMCTSNVCTYPAFASMLVNPSGLAVDAGGQVLVGSTAIVARLSSGGSIARYSSGGAKLSPVASGIVCDQALGIIVATNAFGVYWATSNNVGYAPTAGSPKTYSPPSGKVGWVYSRRQVCVRGRRLWEHLLRLHQRYGRRKLERARGQSQRHGRRDRFGRGQWHSLLGGSMRLDCTSTGDMTGFVPRARL